MGKKSDPAHINETMNDSIAEKTKIPTTAEAIKALKVDMQLPFIDADAYVADPYSLLGQVFQIRKVNGKCPVSLTEGGFSVELTPFPVPARVKESSKMAKPALRDSIIVDKNLSVSVDFLSYLSTSLTANSYYSLIVLDQAAGIIDMQDKDWVPGLKQWQQDNQELIKDPDICYLFAVSGFIQKNIVRKKYVKFTGKAKGGAFGVNVNGELSTSTEDYSLDIKFGLTPIVIKRPTTAQAAMNLTSNKKVNSFRPSKAELNLFSSLRGGTIVKKTKKRQFLIRK